MFYSSRLREEHREKLSASRGVGQPPAVTVAPQPQDQQPSVLDALLLEDGSGACLPLILTRIAAEWATVPSLAGSALDRALLVILSIAISPSKPTAENFKRKGDAVDVLNELIGAGCRPAVAAIASQLPVLADAVYAPGGFIGLVRLELAMLQATEAFHSVSHCQRQDRGCLEVVARVAARSKNGGAVVRAVEMLTCAAFCEGNRGTLLSIPWVLELVARGHPAIVRPWAPAAGDEDAGRGGTALVRRIEWLALLLGVVRVASLKESETLSALIYISMPEALRVPAATERIPVNQCGKESRPRLCFKLPASPPLPASVDPALVPEASACFRILHGASLEHATLLKTRGNGLVASGKHGEAVHLYEVALEALKKLEIILALQGGAKPGPSAAPLPSSASEQTAALKMSLLLNMAQSLLRLGRHAEVVDVSTRAITLQPSNVQARYLRSMARSAIDGPADKAVLDDLLYVRRASENQNNENQDQRWAHFGLL